MSYTDHGNLLSYLDQNINKLTWNIKLKCLWNIICDLHDIHHAGLVHCDIHDGNIILHNYGDDISDTDLSICDLGLSRSVNSRQQKSIVQSGLPFIAPEVFHTRRFTQKSDIYSFGIIMYLMATGEPPFRGREFDGSLICDIMDGLRPTMPDSTPGEYKKLAEQCCDADPDKRPHLEEIDKNINEMLCYGRLSINPDGLFLPI